MLDLMGIKWGGLCLEKEYKYIGGYAVEPNNIRDVIIVRKYGDEIIKIHQINSYPNPKKMYYNKNDDIYRDSVMIDGFEFWADEVYFLGGKWHFVKDFKKKDSQKHNDIKLLNNLTRAKSKILELALCNKFDFFATFTINRNKHNRYDLEGYHKKFSQFIRDYNKKYDLKIKYLLVPEKHKDGAWHEHGFFMGLPVDHLTKFELSQKLPKYLRSNLMNGEDIYNWLPYMNKFGFCDFEPIKSHERASYYVLKYITKDLQRSVSKLGGHLYYASQGLQRAEVIAKGDYNGNLIFDFENDFCKCNTLAFSDDLMKYILSKVTDNRGFLQDYDLSDDFLKECAKHGLKPRKSWVNDYETD